MNIDDIEHIIKILKQNDVTEFELEQEGTRIRLSRGPGGNYVIQQHPAAGAELRPAVVGVASAAAPTPAAVAPTKEDDASGRYAKVESPIVGTFYRKPSPDAEPFVSEGDVVKKGDTLCIIEAMKLMNEIEATTSGRVVKVLSSDGQVVEYGETLFLIDPS